MAAINGTIPIFIKIFPAWSCVGIIIRFIYALPWAIHLKYRGYIFKFNIPSVFAGPIAFYRKYYKSFRRNNL